MWRCPSCPAPAAGHLIFDERHGQGRKLGQGRLGHLKAQGPAAVLPRVTKQGGRETLVGLVADLLQQPGQFGQFARGRRRGGGQAGQKREGLVLVPAQQVAAAEGELTQDEVERALQQEMDLVALLMEFDRRPEMVCQRLITETAQVGRTQPRTSVPHLGLPLFVPSLDQALRDVLAHGRHAAPEAPPDGRHQPAQDREHQTRRSLAVPAAKRDHAHVTPPADLHTGHGLDQETEAVEHAPERFGRVRQEAAVHGRERVRHMAGVTLPESRRGRNRHSDGLDQRRHRPGFVRGVNAHGHRPRAPRVRQVSRPGEPGPPGPTRSSSGSSCFVTAACLAAARRCRTCRPTGDE